MNESKKKLIGIKIKQKNSGSLLTTYNIFEQFVFNNELIVEPNDWSDMVNEFDQEFIIDQISDAISLYNIKLPYREINKEDVINDYFALKNLDTSTLLKKGMWGSKFDYTYNYLNKYIDNSKIGNKTSDYFHQKERWKCDATGYPSPYKTWKNKRFRLTLFKALFSLKVKEINPSVLRSIISLRKYIAAQFRPSAAKCIYDMFGGEAVLDLSMGWGDRLLGAYTSNKVQKYVGFDPNMSLLKGYVDQIEFYGEIDSPLNQKIFNIHPDRAEDESIALHDKFDLIFTSPPYFDKEKYDQSDRQSYKMYKEFDSWMGGFLNKMIELRSKNLRTGGHLIINVSDIYTRKKHYQICNRMNNFISSLGFKYVGAMGLRMPKRPMSKSSKNVGIYGEPMWIHRKV